MEKEQEKEQKWPETLWVVRHGQSAGNVAREAAHAAGLGVIDINLRDVDVPLSELGQNQARAVGRWFGGLPAPQQPTVVLTSPYLRSCSTTELLLESAGIDHDKVTLVKDERLREREFGMLDRLTTLGIEQTMPDQAVMRRTLGKFYYRPPGGESWCDVILRLRSVIDTITREYRRERVLVVCHTVVVFGFRYLLERLDEAAILEIDRQNDLANCAVTSYNYDPAASKNGKLMLDLFNFTAPLEEAGEPVTRLPDVPIAPK